MKIWSDRAREGQNLNLIPISKARALILMNFLYTLFRVLLSSKYTLSRYNEKLNVFQEKLRNNKLMTLEKETFEEGWKFYI